MKKEGARLENQFEIIRHELDRFESKLSNEEALNNMKGELSSEDDADAVGCAQDEVLSALSYDDVEPETYGHC